MHNLNPHRTSDSYDPQNRYAPRELDVVILTNLLDLPPEDILLLYRYRWQIELFFRWFKCILGCKHFLAESERGHSLMVYAALIASLLIVIWTGRRPNKRLLETLQLYFSGWATPEELLAYIAQCPPAHP